MPYRGMATYSFRVYESFAVSINQFTQGLGLVLPVTKALRPVASSIIAVVAAIPKLFHPGFFSDGIQELVGPPAGSP